MMYYWEEEVTIPCVIEHAGVVYANCTMRIRGDTSRIFRKKSYRIELPPEHPMHGRTAWNFNADYLDHSYMRTWLFSRLLGEMGFPCFEASHINVSVNDDNRGIFLLVEPVNKAFLLGNSFNTSGNLYKAQVDGACASIYDDVDSVWAKKTNESAGMNDLIQLIQEVEYCAPEDFGAYMDSTFTMFGEGGLIRLLAVNSVLVNNSTYYHNYYLYNDVEGTGLWNMLPWDVDKILANNLGIGYGSCTNENWYDNPLHARTLVVPAFRDAFIDSVNVIYSHYLTEEKLQYWSDSLEAALAGAVSLDNYDATHLEGFIQAKDELFDNFVTRRSDLQWQFLYRFFPFRSLRSDSVCTGELQVNWLPTSDPSGNPVAYSVVVSENLGPLSEEVLRFEEIQDTTFTITGLAAGDYWWSVETEIQSYWRKTGATDRYNPFTIVEPTVLSGTLGAATTLYKTFSPYMVQGEITVPPGGSLLVQPGVTVLMGEDAAVNCLGSISCLGTAEDSVYFIPENSAAGWRGIRAAGGVVSLQYTVVTGGRGYSDVSGNDFAALCGYSAGVSIENSSFRDNWSCLRLFQGSIFIADSRFINNRGELFFMEDGLCAEIIDTQFINLFEPVAPGLDAMEFYNCSPEKFSVERCSIENIDGDCVHLSSSSVTVSDTELFISTGLGFSIDAVAGVSGLNAEIENCVVSGCSIGIAVNDGACAMIDGVVVSLCDAAVHTYEKTSGMGGGNVWISNSIITGCTESVRIDQGAADVSWSLSDTDQLSGQGNLQGDPQLVQGFYPAWNSPCINSGNPGETDPDGSRRDMGASFFPTGIQGLVVNELMAVNTSTVYDDWGRSSDWIEVYNRSGYDIDAGILVFFDSDSSGADPWSVPRGTMIPEDGYMLFWADGDGWKGGNHLPFRLPGDGGSFKLGRLVPGDGEQPFISTIETVEYNNQTQDVSTGRFPDGGQWRILETPTPGYSNGTQYSVPVDLGWPSPNPCTTGVVTLDITVAGGETNVSVYDMMGRKVATVLDEFLSPGTHTLVWSSESQPTGIYFIYARSSRQTPASARVTILY